MKYLSDVLFADNNVSVISPAASLPSPAAPAAAIPRAASPLPVPSNGNHTSPMNRRAHRTASTLPSLNARSFDDLSDDDEEAAEPDPKSVAATPKAGKPGTHCERGGNCDDANC